MRLSSLDVLRGMTVFGMVLVNNGVGDDQFSTLQHSAWNGLTPCDLVFPFFLYMVGVSIYLSLRGKNFQASPALILRIVKRSIVLFAIGVALHAFEALLHGISAPTIADGTLTMDLDAGILLNLRVWGVLQRIALCYLIASLMALCIPVRHLWKCALTLLVLYSVLLLVGNGYAQDETNLACRLDRSLFGEAHLYRKSPIDPEGLLGTISALAHTLLGITAAWLLIGRKNEKNLLLFAAVLGIAGYLLQSGLPLNKRIWSPSYVLVTCSIASSLLALLTYIIDHKQWNAWSLPFRHLGMNAFFIYVLSEVLAPVFGKYSLPDTMFSAFNSLIPSPQWCSALYALSFALLMTLVACLMGWRKWYVKI